MCLLVSEIILNAPVRLVSITFFQSSAEYLKIKPSLIIAALFITISMLENLSKIKSTEFFTSSIEETSLVMARVFTL